MENHHESSLMHVPLRTACHRSTEEENLKDTSYIWGKVCKPCSVIGSVDSQLELPFWDDRFIALCILVISLSFKSAATCDCWCFLSFADSCLIRSCSAFMVLVYWWDCSTMRALSEAVIFFDASWCAVVSADGLVIPRPPRHSGNAKGDIIEGILTCKGSEKFPSDHLLQWWKKVANVGHSSGEILQTRG